MNPESTDDILIRLRALVARRQEAEALLVLDEIRRRSDPTATSRAWVQIALLRHESESEKLAEEAMLNAASTLAEHLCDDAPLACLEAQLQVARVWHRIGQDDQARHAYATLINALRRKDWPARSQEQHLMAIAEYRLADLRLADSADEALERWRRVVELRDEEVSPYAALRMTQELGEGYLVGERVEKLFHYAMGTSDPQLFAEATIGLAQHLKSHNQFGESRRYLDSILEGEYDDTLVAQAREELAGMDHHESMVKEGAPLRRLWSMEVKARKGEPTQIGNYRRVVIIGAGTGGTYLRESLDPKRYLVCGFVDDNAAEVPGDAGDPILGRISDLGRLLPDIQPNEVLLAIPTLAGVRRQEVVLSCRRAGVPLLNLPGMHELGIGWARDESRRSLMSQLREVKVAEILGDERRALDTSASSWLQYKVAVVIGAGAIGAELCRRLADAEVRRLVIVDRRESALKKIETELREVRKFLLVDVQLGRAEAPEFLATVFAGYEPDVVFNATGDGSPRAFDPDRLIRDATGWTTLLSNEAAVAWQASRAAAQAKVPLVIHISTRRAGVAGDPLGAMKEICEELFLHRAARYPETRSAVVRIGAVLDSLNGRLSTLEEQIRSGAVVKAPPAEARAQFVPTWRWAELILHASRLAQGGEIFEPDDGVEIAPRKVIEDAIELADMFVDDVKIEDSTERWDEPSSPANCRCEQGWPNLGVWKLKRSAPEDDRLQNVIDECAHWIDARVAGGSGKAVPLVHGALECLRELPVESGR